MNEHDSENIAGMLEAMGYEYCDDAFKADLVVMNTCSVRENADKRFYGMLGQFKKRKENGEDFIMCVCGCMPQQEVVRNKIKKSFYWVDIVFGTQTIDEFPALLNERLNSGKKQFSIVANSEDLPEEKTAKRMHRHKALINITYGCNNFCTYCIVPFTRGREKSRSLDDIYSELVGLVEDGVKEVMLLGQNVNSFKDADGNDFAMLIRKLNEIEGVERIRFMTSHPKDISDDLISCYSECEKLCRHIHLPVQSGSNAVLKRMNRRYDREKYLAIVRRLRETCPEITITTDIIVGFPGESEEDFSDTLSLVNEVGYDSAFTFIYSPRTGTPAARYEDQIPEPVKHERFERLVETVNAGSAEKNSAYVGRVYRVLVEGEDKKQIGNKSGRTDGFKLVNFTGEAETGEFVNVLITGSNTFSLTGETVKNHNGEIL